MDREIWTRVMAAVRSADRQVPRCGRKCTYSDRKIVKMVLWATWHDRPMRWACDRSHYNTLCRIGQLPSESQFCRRRKKPRIQEMLRCANRYLADKGIPSKITFLDGKPLPVGGFSRDPDARNGYGVGGMQRGYKLHAWTTQDGCIPLFSVHPLNEGEPKVARQMAPDIPPARLVVGDANYDSAPLYTEIDNRGSQLLTPLKGRARSAARLRRMGPGRRQALRLWDCVPDQCQRLTKVERIEIERTFSALTCFGGGLTPLPPWVRRLPRVRLWVTAKLVIYHARLLARKTAG